ncbi:DUF3095 domain-containing protein [Mangrovicella endophytica]|uniref:DUF3095 domain-containing protein n=1 Tax=Mangrovicella endophytica TaxID=2066697 RepID=UPI000C9EC600|nr:DUF3095 domain-containing protein [Mangrovicella endophytica]
MQAVATTVADAGFYAGLQPLDRFDRLADPAAYAPLPPDWGLGMVDIVDSTGAIAAGRYKEVNMAAASAIAAVANALGRSDIPYAFAGDGASFALEPAVAQPARVALARVAGWVRDELGLDMRIALIPVRAIRAAGHDLKLARFAVSPDVTYAMFAGGGLAWAERQMKDGAFRIEPAVAGDAGPDLTGLSCRFDEFPARRGAILSLIVTPAEDADMDRFTAVVRHLLRLADSETDGGHPVPVGGPGVPWSRRGRHLESRASAALKHRGRLSAAVLTGLRSSFAAAILAAGQRLGRFDPTQYLDQLVRNTDFRKYDDGLRMTLDCSAATAAGIEALLRQARADGIVCYGLHSQQAALMTCFIPSPMQSNHVHFVDGAAGGYAMAAQAMKTAAGPAA